MSDFQPLVNIQFSPSGVDLGNYGVGGNGAAQAVPLGSNLFGQSISTSNLSPHLGIPNSSSGPLAQFCNPSLGQNTDVQSIARQFSAALESIVAAFKSILDSFLSKMQAPSSTSTVPTSTVPTSTVPTSTVPISTAPPTTNTPNTTPSSGTTSTPTTSSGTSSSQTPTSSVSSSASTTSASDSVKQLAKTGQFLWKPKAEKDGKLVVLIPKKFGRAKAVRVLSSDGKTVLASGKYSGIANGDRAHYRFSKAGAEFPPGSIVEIVRQNGQKEQLSIKDPSKRLVH